MNERNELPTTQDLQGQIDALKQVLLFVLDALADSDVDIIRAVGSRIPTSPIVLNLPIPGDESGPARQRALNDIARDLVKMRMGIGR